MEIQKQQKKQEGMLQSLITKVGFNIKVNIRNLIVKYKQDNTLASFYCGLVSISSARPDTWQQDFIVISLLFHSNEISLQYNENIAATGPLQNAFQNSQN